LVKAQPDAPRNLTLDSVVELGPYFIHRDEGRPPLLGSEQSRRVMEVDDETIQVLESFSQPRRLRDVERAVLERTGQEYDMVEFATHLYARGFLRSIDGVVLTSERSAKDRHRLLYSVPPAALAWIRHPLTLLAVFALVDLWIFSLAHTPDALPRAHDIFAFHRPSLIALSTLIGFVLFGYVHELAHFFTARSYGVDARISVSHRFYLLVLETDVTKAWMIRPAKRLHIFLAGIMLNLTIASLAGLGVWSVYQGFLSPAWEPWLRFVIALNVIPLAFQLMFFARTDLYYVILTLLGERNLAFDSRRYLRLRLWHALRGLLRKGPPRRDCPECSARAYEDEPFCLRCGHDLPVRDANMYPFQHAARWKLASFGVIYLAGQTLGFALILLVVFPIQLLQLEISWIYFRQGLATNGWVDMLDASILLALLTLQASALPYFALRGLAKTVRDRRNRPRPTTEAAPAPKAIVDAAARDLATARKRRKNKQKRRAHRAA
jgi:hypothetical protein